MIESQIRIECLEQFGVEKYRKLASSLNKLGDDPTVFGRLKFWQQSIVDHLLASFPNAELDSTSICAALHACDVHDLRLVNGPGYQIHGFRNPASFQKANEEQFPFGYGPMSYHCPQCAADCQRWIADHAKECLISAQSMADSFPPRIAFPQELGLLCEAYREFGYPLSGCFRLREHNEHAMQRWFGSDAVAERFAQFGANVNGSMYCLWRSPDGGLPIVHLDSDGDHNKVLASSPLDFIRLLATGYSEIGYNDLSQPPAQERDHFSVDPKFQRWVIETFGTTIPVTGANIVESASIAYPDFAAWVQAHCG